MYFNTFLLSFGFKLEDFLSEECSTIETDNGFTYLLTQNKDKIPCPICKSLKNVKVKDYYFNKINSSNNELKESVFRIKRIRFVCSECNKTFSKHLHGINAGCSISNDVKKSICASFSTFDTFEKIAQTYHVSATEVIKIFDNDIADVDRLPLPKILCIDEFFFSNNKDQKYCCILLDWESKKIVDIIRNRRLDYLKEYFSKIPENERKNVEYFVSDMYDGYATIQKTYFKKAVHIIDFFHVVLQLTRTTNIIRTAVMKNYDKDSIEYKFIKKYWKLFIAKTSKIPSSKTFKTNKSPQEFPVYDLFFEIIRKNPSLNYAYTNLQSIMSMEKDQKFSEASKKLQFIINNLRQSQNNLLMKVADTYETWSIGIANTFSFHKSFKNISNGPCRRG